MIDQLTLTTGVELTATISPETRKILVPEATELIAALDRSFKERRQELLQRRDQRQMELNKGKLPDFLAETIAVRNGEWIVEPIPVDLQDRRVEITGPTDRKMVINALNSGAKVFMADFEDANTPTWSNLMEGHINLRDAICRSIEFKSPEGREYRLKDQVAVPQCAGRRTGQNPIAGWSRALQERQVW